MTKNEAADPGAFRLFTKIGIIEQLARNRLERRLPDGLKVSQFVVLNHLLRLGGAWNPKRLADAMQVTSGAMTNTLTRLEGRGLIELAADPHDKRGKLVRITKAGRNMRARCVESVGPVVSAVSGLVSDKELAATLDVLEKVRKYLDTHRR